MKKPDTIIGFFAVTVILLALVMVLIIIEPASKDMYAMTTKVVRVSRANDTVTVKDFNGNYWQFKGVEDWYVGDICSCIMDNNGTEEITDDEIISTHYDGWVERWAD